MSGSIIRYPATQNPLAWTHLSRDPQIYLVLAGFINLNKPTKSRSQINKRCRHSRCRQGCLNNKYNLFLSSNENTYVSKLTHKPVPTQKLRCRRASNWSPSRKHSIRLSQVVQLDLYGLYANKLKMFLWETLLNLIRCNHTNLLKRTINRTTFSSQNLR